MAVCWPRPPFRDGRGKNDLYASEYESAEYFEEDYEGDTDSKLLIKVENEQVMNSHAVKRKAEVNQETDISQCHLW